MTDDFSCRLISLVFHHRTAETGLMFALLCLLFYIIMRITNKGLLHVPVD